MRPHPRKDKSEGLDVVVDLGATHYRIGVPNSQLQEPAFVGKTPRTKEQILDDLCDSITKVAGQYHSDLSSVTVGCPGLVNEAGMIFKSLYLPLTGCNLRASLSERLHLANTQVINDAKGQALSLLDQYVSTFYVVLGTGVGGAIIDRGRLVQGANSFAGEVGHIKVGNHSDECVCGRQGCLDAYASGMALSKKLGDGWYGRPLTPNADDALFSAGYHVAQAVTIGMNLLDPEAVVIAGHITAQPSFQSGFSNGWKKNELMKVQLTFLEQTWPLAFRGLTFLIRRAKHND
jgi:predicted NBD/HSP70 family sugar kinase